MHLAAIHLPCNVEVELFDIYVKKHQIMCMKPVEICVQNALKLTYKHL